MDQLQRNIMDYLKRAAVQPKARIWYVWRPRKGMTVIVL